MWCAADGRRVVEILAALQMRVAVESVMDQFRRREKAQRFRLLFDEIVADETERERTLKLRLVISTLFNSAP